MVRLLSLLSVTVSVAALAMPVGAEDLLPPDKPIEEVIDRYIDAELKVTMVTPTPTASDSALLRRTTLDLVGRIPTAREARAFVESQHAEKRVELVDRLIASPGFVRHQADEFDAFLMDGTRGSLRNYLLKAFEENRSWDQMFREMMLAGKDQADAEKQKDAKEFLKQRIKDIDQLANNVSVTFFGVNISCAKCHDHPLVDEWKQDHFFGMKSFFSRTFDNGDFLGEHEHGLVKFKTTGGEDKTAKLMFLTGTVLEEPEAKEPKGDEQKALKKKLEELKKKKQPPPPPKFSRRAQLLEVALREGENDFFARSIVNRLFYRFFGQGLVMPIDQMHDVNPASHPALLQWLARDLVAHNYDLRRLVRGIVLSNAYARDSRWTTGEQPDAWLFSVGLVRPLMPQSLATSLRVAGTSAEQFPEGQEPEAFEKKIEGLENSGRGWARSFEKPGEDFQVSVTEALWFSNNNTIQSDLLSEGGDRLVGQLKAIEDPQKRVEAAVWNVLSRAPTAEETKLLSEYMSSREDRLSEACRQVVWALMTSSEFRFNH